MGGDATGLRRFGGIRKTGRLQARSGDGPHTLARGDTNTRTYLPTVVTEQSGTGNTTEAGAAAAMAAAGRQVGKAAVSHAGTSSGNRSVPGLGSRKRGTASPEGGRRSRQGGKNGWQPPPAHTLFLVSAQLFHCARGCEVKSGTTPETWRASPPPPHLLPTGAPSLVPLSCSPVLTRFYPTCCSLFLSLTLSVPEFLSMCGPFCESATQVHT